MARGRSGRPLHRSMLENYVTATRPVVTEDRYGDLRVTSNTIIANFWADITELEPTDFGVDAGKKRQTRMIKLVCRSEDIQNVELDDILTFGNSDEEWQVNEFHEARWKYGKEIHAEYRE